MKIKKGYVIYCDRGLYKIGPPMVSHKNDFRFKRGILWFGVTASIFKTSRAAYQTLERTKKYADVAGLCWRTWLDKSHVQPVNLAVL